MSDSDSRTFENLIQSAGLPERLARLARRGVLRRYRKETVFIVEDATGDELFILLKGSVRVFSADVNGREIMFGLHRAGDYVGEMSLDGGRRSASVRAAEPVAVSVVNRQTVVDFVRDEPEFAFDLLARVIRRARLATESARNMALLDVYSRVTRMLNEASVSDPATGDAIVPYRMTHREIAARVGASREMISRIMKELAAGGYIAVDKSGIRLRRALPSAW